MYLFFVHFYSVRREAFIPATDPGVLSVTQFHSGTTNNVIADSAVIQGTMRALSDRTRARLIDGLPRVVEGIAQSHEARAQIEIISGYPVVENDEGFESFARDVAADLLGPQSIVALPSPLMGSEDFSYVLQRVPGAMLLLGVRPPDSAHPAPCHSSRLLLDEEALALGVALHASIAARFLTA